MANENKTVVTLICERAADVNSFCDADGKVASVEGLHVIKLPCSGMIQTLMIDDALKAGAAGVIVCGCQIGDCYYREGNKMIRERLLGERPPGLKKTVDRRRILALWLSRVQKQRFLDEAKNFVEYVHTLEPAAGAAAKPAPAAKAEPAKSADAAPAKDETKDKDDSKPAKDETKAKDDAKPAKDEPKAKDEGKEDTKSEN